MSYGEYGGRVYRDGVRIPIREDAPIRAGGFGCHAVLGDGRVRLGLYKQSDLFVYLDGKRLDVTKLLAGTLEGEAAIILEGLNSNVLNTEVFRRNGVPCVMEAGGCRIEVFFTSEDNFYQYARLTQPDGTVWLGWSGYGVGTGDDAYYGDYSAAERDKRLMELFGVELDGGEG